MRRMVTTKQQELVEQLNELIRIINGNQFHFLGEKFIAQATEIDFHGTDYVSLYGVTDEYGEPKYYFDINEDQGISFSYYDSDNDDVFSVMHFTPETGMSFNNNSSKTAALELGAEGDIHIYKDGNLVIHDLPTSDPQVEGALWNDNGVLKISAGE